jgi:hypothetical protein
MIRQNALNRKVSGLRVPSRIVPAVTDVLYLQPAHLNKPFPREIDFTTPIMSEGNPPYA